MPHVPASGVGESTGGEEAGDEEEVDERRRGSVGKGRASERFHAAIFLVGRLPLAVEKRALRT